jgi:L-threonylcarbamoyladenylate synthase
MKTRVLTVNRQMPEWEHVKVAGDVITSGGIVCLPTDTTYGFAASIYFKEAIDRLRAMKGRGPLDPFVIIVSDMGMVSELVTRITTRHRRLMEVYWPGPLTIVFEASDRVPDYLVGSDGTVALRIPNDTLTQSVLRACSQPLAAPSANLRGRHPALEPDEVLRCFSGKIDLLLDGGDMESREPSTIVAVRASSCEVLRQGRISVGKV